MSFNGRTPAAYVDFLVNQGIPTNAGPVCITSYVSTGSRSPLAVQVYMYFNQVLTTVRYSSARRSEARGIQELHRRIVTRGGRDTHWRRVFTGQGIVEDLADVMNYILDHQDFLREDPRSPLAGYLTSIHGAQALRRMAREEIFGLDCLGFTGSYLVWCGVEPHYPEHSQPGYISGLGFRPVSSLAEVDARCVALWLTPPASGEASPDAAADADRDTRGHAGLHCGYVNDVTARDAAGITITFCQSSRGGPQTNLGVRLTLAGPDDGGRTQFRISGGAPSLPVTGLVVIGKRRDLS